MKCVLMAVILVLVLVTGAYTAIVMKKRPNRKWNWYDTFVATVVSVLAAFAAGLLLYGIQSEVESQARKQQLQEVLITELEHKLEKLNHPSFLELTVGTDTMKFNLTYYEPLVFQEAARSAMFGTDVTKRLCRLIENFQTYNMEVQHTMALLASGQRTKENFNSLASRAQRALEGMQPTLIVQTEKLLEKVKEDR